MPELVIDPQLLPKDGRFGCGPSRTRAEQLANFSTRGAALMGTSHRQAPIKDLVGEIRSGLLEFFRAPEGYEVILGNGGSTAFWDAAAFSLALRKAQALVHGEFGSKFANALTTPWLEAPTIVKAEPGSRAELYPEVGVDLYVYPHNETSTGVIAPVKRINGDADALMLTDATSAAGGVDFDLSQTDVYYFAPQKNFASDGGLWLALVSPKAIERIEAVAASDRYIPEFLSLKVALDNSRLNQTLNTPAIATLFLLNDQIKWLNRNGGLTWAAARTKESSDLLYAWADAHPKAKAFVSNPDHRSQVVVTIDFDDSVDAAKLAKILRENNIVDTDPYRKLGRNQLRVATFVATEPSDVKALVKCIEFVLERMS
ncbi:MAG: phosphoserine transaminase [Actinobacteria bacterium]|nr:phosphoserine transaminase [Actinomycetota bacterium]